jgi:hypothetical protein
LYIDVNINNIIFVGTYCYARDRVQMTLRGPQINNMPSKNHVIVLLGTCTEKSPTLHN